MCNFLHICYARTLLLGLVVLIEERWCLANDLSSFFTVTCVRQVLLDSLPLQLTSFLCCSTYEPILCNSVNTFILQLYLKKRAILVVVVHRAVSSSFYNVECDCVGNRAVFFL